MKTLKQLIAIVLGFVAFTGILVVLSVGLLVNGIDESIDNQNEMLCNSARVSGNREYLDLCEEYYETGDIEYMREE